MIALLWLSACIEERAPIDVPLHFEGSSTTFTLPAGEISLTHLEIVISDIRLLGTPDTFAWVPSLLPVAHAHPGHEFSGDVRAELLGRFVLDVMQPGSALGSALGYTGEVDTGRLEFESVSMAGTIATESGTLPFAIDLPLLRALPGIPVDSELTIAAERHTLAFDAQAAFTFLTFDDENADGWLDGQDTRFANTTVFGMTSLDAWTLEKR